MASRISGMFKRDRDGNCTEVHDLSSDLIDGELDSKAATRIEGHLDVCPLCTAFFNTLKETVRLLSSSKTSRPVPPSFISKLRAGLRQERGQL